MSRRPHVVVTRRRSLGFTITLVVALVLTTGLVEAQESEPNPAETTPTETTPTETTPDRTATTSDGTVTKTLKWATASEVDNFGYDVYRAEHPDGPFERRTDEPVLGAGTTDEPSYYRWIDEGLDPAKNYYYYVESISIHDERERFTPIIEVKARIAGDDGSGDDGPDDDSPSSEGGEGESTDGEAEAAGGDG